MGIIANSVFGDISGKVGGIVFTRNVNGKYIREYVKGIDAKSLQQIANRSRWSSIVSNWKSVSRENKLLWKMYAINIFKPKHGKKLVNYSGYAAYVSVNCSVGSLLAASFDPLFLDPEVTWAFSGFNYFLSSPPTKSFSGQIHTSSGEIISLSLSNAIYVVSSGLLSVKVGMSQPVSGLPPVFQDYVSGNWTGFSVYFSTILSAGRTVVPHYDVYLVGSFPSPLITAGWVSQDNFTIGWYIPSEYLAKLKYAFPSGSEVFVSLYANGTEGGASFIGRKLITIS